MSRPAQEPADQHEPADQRTPSPARERRVEYQARWVDLEVQRSIARGEFDDLPGAGKPIADLGDEHDPDWWLKRLIERERISVLPAALALRTEDARLHEELDVLGSAEQVRERLEDFNERIVQARRQLQGGPPVITPLRDVEAEVIAWRQRRQEQAARAQEQSRHHEATAPRRRHWWARARRR